MKKALFAVAVALLVGAIPPQAFAQHCLENMSAPARSRVGEFMELGSSSYYLEGPIDELEWRVTFHEFKRQHARLNITAMEVREHKRDRCFDYLVGVTLSIEPIRPSDDARAPWGTISLGHRKSPKDYLRIIEKFGGRIGVGRAEETATTLRLVPMAREPRNVTLAVVTPAQLGFKESVKRTDVYAQAKAIGLELCPAEAALAMRENYTTQPRDERLVVAMEPILTPSRNDNWRLPYIIGLDTGSDGTRWLVTDSSFAGDYIGLDQKLVFVLSQ